MWPSPSSAKCKSQLHLQSLQKADDVIQDLCGLEFGGFGIWFMIKLGRIQVHRHLAPSHGCPSHGYSVSCPCLGYSRIYKIQYIQLKITHPLSIYPQNTREYPTFILDPMFRLTMEKKSVFLGVNPLIQHEIMTFTVVIRKMKQRFVLFFPFKMNCLQKWVSVFPCLPKNQAHGVYGLFCCWLCFGFVFFFSCRFCVSGKIERI